MMKNKLAERNRSKIVRSLLEYFTGEGDPSQREILENWLGEDEKNRVLFEQLNDESYVQEGVEEFRRYDSREGWQKVEGRIRVRRRRLLVRWSYFVRGGNHRLECVFGTWGKNFGGAYRVAGGYRPGEFTGYTGVGIRRDDFSGTGTGFIDTRRDGREFRE